MNEAISSAADKFDLVMTISGLVTAAFSYYVAKMGIQYEKETNPNRNVSPFVDSITPALYAVAGAVVGTFGGYILSATG